MSHPMSRSDSLPVASGGVVRAYIGGALRADWHSAVAVVLLYVGASVAGLVGPHVLGDVVAEAGSGGSSRALAHVNDAVLIFLVALVLQSLFIRGASRLAGTVTSRLLSSIRVEFGGGYQEQQRSFKDLAFVLILLGSWLATRGAVTQHGLAAEATR